MDPMETTIRMVASMIYARLTGKEWLRFPNAAQARVQDRYMAVAKDVTALVQRHIEIDDEEAARQE